MARSHDGAREAKSVFRSKWALIFGAWTLYGVYMMIQSIIVRAQLGSPIPFVKALVGELAYAWLWFALTPAVIRIAGAFRFEKGRLLSSILIHSSASILLAIVHKVLHGMILGLYSHISEGTRFSWISQYEAMLRTFDYGIHLYWLIVIVYFAAAYYTRFREKETEEAKLRAQLTQAQLDALKMQVQPHFLFNTLNAISVLVTRNPDTARKMILQLSDLLRYTLEQGKTHEISLRDELEFLNRYLDIERMRFEDRLTIRQNIQPDTLDAFVPNMILQPLVENALKHGLASRPGPARLEIDTVREDDRLSIRIADNGEGFPAAGESQPKEGIGIANTRARLQQLYRDKQSFTMTNENGSGVAVTLTIPYRAAREKHGSA